MFKKIRSCVWLLVAAMIGCLVFSFAACANNDEDGDTRTVIDMTGATITIPKEVNSYIVLWKSHTGVLAMLDGCAGLKGCDYDVTQSGDAWLFEICPVAKNISIVTESISVEEVLEMKVDVVFWQSPACADLAAQLINVGVPAVNVDYTDYASMKKSISLTAEVLGTDAAKSKAEKYNAHLDSVVNEISAKTSTLSDSEKVTVINLRKLSTLRADGKDTVADTWINICGGINIVSANNLSGNQYLNAEQVFEWDPDFIISSGLGDQEEMYASSLYSNLKCVKNHHVYTNPQGIFWWNRYCVETTLQLKWAANKFHPELFNDIDIVSETKDFYSEFFDYQITDADVQNMLLAGAPSSFGA